MEGSGGGEAAAWLFGSGGALALAGGVLTRWLSRRESRMTKLERKVDRLNAKVIMVGGALSTAVGEIRLHFPTSPNLTHYDRVLKIAFPVERALPESLETLLGELDSKEREA